VELLKDALKEAQPEIFNTDQGSQFTSYAFTDVLKDHSIRRVYGAILEVFKI
jgi:putative transposase